MTVQVSAKSSEQKPRYNLDIKILSPGEFRNFERSSASNFHLKAQQPKKKKVQCISFNLLAPNHIRLFETMTKFELML